MGIIITDILIIIMLWLMSNAVCVLVGFFVGRKGQFTQSKKLTERKIEPISKEEQLKRDRELQEYINMMTYDGTEQQPIDAIKR